MDGGSGGNPAPVALNAHDMTNQEMQDIARHHNLESVFVLPATSAEFDFRLRYWVPNHEMSMCGHATLGALWLMRNRGLLNKTEVRIETLAGLVTGRFVRSCDGAQVPEISQPPASIEPVTRNESIAAILAALDIRENNLLPGLPILNASTSRVKTLVPIRTVEILDSIQPRAALIEPVNKLIGSTGLYPFAPSEPKNNVFDARQFPKNSGYIEDPATGIAASALAFGLLHYELIDPSLDRVSIRQGRAMGCSSRIEVRFERNSLGEPIRCWLSGSIAAIQAASLDHCGH